MDDVFETATPAHGADANEEALEVLEEEAKDQKEE